MANEEVRTEKKETENEDWKLLYKISDSPPIFLTILFAFQQTLMALPFCVIVAIMVAQAVCADDDNELKTQLLSTTIFLSALSTLLQTTFGVRLPVFQGPTPAYIVPILVLANMPGLKCPALPHKIGYNETTGSNYTTEEYDVIGYRESVVYPKLRIMQGSLILAGAIHMLIGLTGFVGILLKVVGPLTVVPMLLLLGIELYSVMNSFCEPHWGVAAGTCLISIIFAVYLNGWNMPIPMYTRERGCHFIRYPIQQVLAILFAIMIGWSICGILTYSGVLTTDPNNKQFKARTDYGSDTVQNTPWFTIPYPGQFGASSFNTGIFMAFFIATLLSIIESIADCYACAILSHVPPPPIAAMNRGIMMEGFMAMIAGFFGAGHATTTFSNNVGLIGLTKVASRRVFQAISVQLIICAIIGKLGAVFVTIPYPVLGGSGIISFGLFMGVIMSYLQFTDMTSPRNLAVVGVALFTGLMVPNWMKVNSEVIKTGNEEFDKFLIMTLTNTSLFGGIVAFILDNTVKGTQRERGMVAWSLGESQSGNGHEQMEETLDVYEIPCLTKLLDKLPCFKFLPVFPRYTPDKCQCKNGETVVSRHDDVAIETVIT